MVDPIALTPWQHFDGGKFADISQPAFHQFSWFGHGTTVAVSPLGRAVNDICERCFGDFPRDFSFFAGPVPN